MMIAAEKRLSDAQSSIRELDCQIKRERQAKHEATKKIDHLTATALISDAGGSAASQKRHKCRFECFQSV